MRSSLVACVVSLALLVLGLSGYGVLRTVIVNKSVKVVERAEEIEAKNASVARAASLEAALAEIAAQEALVRSYIVPETGVVALIDDLEARGRSQEAVVEIKSVAAAPSGRSALLLALTVTGSFDAVMRTVGSIEYAPYDLTIIGFTLVEQRAEGAGRSWTATLNLSVGSAPITPSS